MSPTGKQYNFEVTTPTIRDFILNDYHKMNVNPEGQRLDTEPKLEAAPRLWTRRGCPARSWHRPSLPEPR